MAVRESVGEEERFVDGVGLVRINGVGEEDGQDDDQGVEPCVAERYSFPSSQEGAGFSAL
jgi:hypothetical protein